ncbi:MAG: hypothetical protein ABIX01_18995 [Chitinophagaceae bacterium]
MLNDTDLAIEVERYLSLQQEGRIIKSQASEKAKLQATLQKLNQRYLLMEPGSVSPAQRLNENQSSVENQ